MDFSIVTPSYNYGRFIGACLESVAQQKGITFEHLVMDACSTDDTAEVVSRFPHANLFQEPDEGMSDGINKGFRRAVGKWVMWLNADDLLQPGALMALKEFAEKHSEADVIYGSYRFIDADGAKIRDMKLIPYSRFISIHHGCYVPSTATFLKRETTVDEELLLDVRMKQVMDNEYYARLSLAKKSFVYFPCVLAGFRVHDSNTSGVGGLPSGTMEAELSNASMRSEAEAVRRIYGITLFKNIFFTHGVDCVLYLIAWFCKGVLRIPSVFVKMRLPRQMQSGEICENDDDASQD